MRLLARSAPHAAQRQMEFANWLRRNRKRAFRDRILFMRAYTGSQPTGLSTTDGESNIEQLSIGMLNTEFALHSTATPVWVTANAHDLIDEAASMLPPTEVLLDSEVNKKDVILWFERPYHYDLLAGVKVDEFIEEKWQVEAIAVQYVEQMATKFNETVGSGLQVILYGRPTNPDKVDEELFQQETGGLVLIDCIGIRTHLSWDAFPHAAWVSALKSWIVAMYRLMGDHIDFEPAHAGRAERRRLERLGFPPDGYITELRLRKVAYGNEGEGDGSGAPLRFRHRVRGHWRKFYCSSMGKVGDPEAYRHRYVNDYIRGPKESPVIESQQVITLAK